MVPEYTVPEIHMAFEGSVPPKLFWQKGSCKACLLNDCAHLHEKINSKTKPCVCDYPHLNFIPLEANLILSVCFF